MSANFMTETDIWVSGNFSILVSRTSSISFKTLFYLRCFNNFRFTYIFGISLKCSNFHKTAMNISEYSMVRYHTIGIHKDVWHPLHFHTHGKMYIRHFSNHKIKLVHTHWNGLMLFLEKQEKYKKGHQTGKIYFWLLDLKMYKL